MSTFVVVEEQVVVNRILMEPSVAQEWTDNGVWPQGQTPVDVTALEPMPQIGWGYSGGAFCPPPTLDSDLVSITGDGVAAATVTYANSWPGSPASVTFTVNDASLAEVPLVDGQAAIEVASTTPGDTITVQAAGLTVQIEVT